MSYSSQTPPPYYNPTTQSTSVWAIVSIISGVLAWIGLFGLGGIVAVVCGYVAKNEIRASGMRIGGDGIATIGLVLGYLNIAISLLAICLFGLMFAGIISGAAICPFLFGGPTQ